MVIEARGLTKRFGKAVALDDIDLNVARGSAFGLLGPAGSGKSTVIRLLAGLARPSGGTLSIGGEPGGSLAARRRLGVLLQDTQLYPWMTGREALAFAADLAGVDRAALDGRIGEVSRRLALEDALPIRVESMPAPTRGRLAIAHALVGDPEVLLLDEPFHRLDPEGRDDVLALLRELRGKTTIVLAAHRPADVDALCDRMAVLEAGRILRTSKVTPPGPRRPGAAVAGGGPAAVRTAEPTLADRAFTLAARLIELLGRLSR